VHGSGVGVDVPWIGFRSVVGRSSWVGVSVEGVQAPKNKDVTRMTNFKAVYLIGAPDKTMSVE
jgi:hypothetical protein